MPLTGVPALVAIVAHAPVRVEASILWPLATPAISARPRPGRRAAGDRVLRERRGRTAERDHVVRPVPRHPVESAGEIVEEGELNPDRPETGASPRPPD